MKVLKTSLIMLAILVSLTLALRAAQDFDILDFLPAISRSGSKCNFTGLKQMFTQYANDAAAKVVAADKLQVVNFVSLYPEGGAPPTLTVNSQGESSLQIPSRAAAYYLAGVEAVQQGSRFLALWCFTEAAWRNPGSAMFLNNAAFALIEFGYLADARTALECAKSLEPDYVPVYTNLGKALVGLGFYGAAGESYEEAFTRFPNNSDNCRLAAEAYKKAGMLSQAYALGKMGKTLFPTKFDWDSFLNSLNFHPDSECIFPDDIFSNAFAMNLFEQIDQIRMEMHREWESQTAKQHDTAMYAWYTWLPNCEAANPYNCGYDDDCCIAKSNIYSMRCDIKARTDIINSIDECAGSAPIIFNKYLKRAGSLLNDNKGKLEDSHYNCILCVLNYNFCVTSLDSFTEDISLGTYEKGVNIERIRIDLQSIAESWTKCIGAGVIDPDVGYGNLSRAGLGYTEWLLTGMGKVGVTSKYCAGVFCMTFDSVNKTFGFEATTGLAVKVTYSPLNGAIGLHLGVGWGDGIGSLNLGGAAYVKFEFDKLGSAPKKIGVEGEINISHYKGGGFYGFVHL